MTKLSEQEFLKKLGSKIKLVRNEKGWSLNEISIKCGIEKASISRIESGKSNITLKTLFKLSLALEVTVAHFFAK